MPSNATGSIAPTPTKYDGIYRNSRAIFHRTESKQQRAAALRIALEDLELPITIAARRVGLRVVEAVKLYIEFSMDERARLRARRLRSIA